MILYRIYVKEENDHLLTKLADDHFGCYNIYYYRTREDGISKNNISIEYLAHGVDDKIKMSSFLFECKENEYNIEYISIPCGERIN